MRKHITIISIALLAAGLCAQGRQMSPRTAMAAARQMSRAAGSTVSAYIHVDRATVDIAAIEALGMRISCDMGDILTARMPIEAAQALADVEGVEYLQLGSPVHQTLDLARNDIGINAVNRGLGVESPCTGTGVIVGIVDSGFDYGHAAFRDEAGNLRIKRVWEQETEPYGSLSSPEPFGYGTEMTTADQILEAEGDILDNSHGTHVTSIAAGSDNYLNGRLRGMAPDAEIVLVSMLQAGTANVNISDAIAYIFNYADLCQRPCVVNISLGTPTGPHDGTSAFDMIVDRLSGPGRLVVGAAGNQQGDRFHINRTFAGTDDEPLRTFIEHKSRSGDIDIWADGPVEASLLVVRTATGEEASRVKAYPAENPVEVLSLGRNVSGSVTAATETNPFNGKVHIEMRYDVSNVRANYSVVLEIKPEAAATADIWVSPSTIELTDKGIPGYTAPAGESSLTELGGTAKRILTVGAYTTRSHFTTISTMADSDLGETVGDIWSHSGRGPTADGRIKPQVSAPGCFISAAVSNYDNSGSLFLSQSHNTGSRDNLYGFMQGTSMATPMLTGIVATWLQAYPDMTPEDLAEIVAATSRHDTYTGSALPDNIWGSGKVDALAGLKEAFALRDLNSLPSTMSPSESFAVSADRRSGSVKITCLDAASEAVVSIHSIDGRLQGSYTLRDIEPGETRTITPALTGGTYLVSIAADGRTLTLKTTL